MVNTLENIKNLRNVSGAGFLDCKKALEENNNDIEKSVDYLRKKGLIKASKKTSREANEGAVGVFYNDIKYVLIEINTETDFAAKNELFLNFVNQIASYALKLDSTNEINIKDFLKLEFEGKIISDYFNEIIAKIGENIVLKKLHFIHNNNSNKIYTYTHNAYRENIGKICVALNVQVENDNPEASLLGKNLCMQIAALKPLSIDIENLDKKIIEREKEIQLESIKSSGKEQRTKYIN